MNITDHPLPGVKIIELKPMRDARGHFVRVWDKAILAQAGIEYNWVQENQSFSEKPHTTRGFHFQRPPHAETKLVRCVAGRVLDAFIDLRKSSPTYGKAATVELDADQPKMILIPRGFAHGYMTLTPNSIVSYKCDAMYAPEAEGGVRWDDPTLDIKWPIQTPVLSDKDTVLPLLSEIEPLVF